MNAPLDGNVLAGAFRELFAVEITAAVVRCRSCGRVDAVGGMDVYADAPGLVGRCPGCQQVLVRLVRGPGRAWLDLSGMTCLEVAIPSP